MARHLQLNTAPAASPYGAVTGCQSALAQAHYLGLANVSVLRRAVAEGLEALEQEYVQAAMSAITRLNNCPQQVHAPYSTAQQPAQYCAACQREPLPEPASAALGCIDAYTVAAWVYCSPYTRWLIYPLLALFRC